MDKKTKITLEELAAAPEESEDEKKHPNTLDLEEPKRRLWLRLLIWVVVLGIIGGAAYTGLLVYRSNQNFSVEEKIEGKIDLDGNSKTDPTPSFVYVNTSDGLNLRSEPSSSSDIVVVVPDKTKLEVVKLDDGWYQVKFNDKEGYVRNEFVTKALPPAN